MTGRPIAELAALAQMIQDRELAMLRVLSARRQDAQAAQRACREAQSRAISQAGPTPAFLAGTDAQWLRLNAQRLRAATERAAQAAVEVEDQLMAARKAFGRADALARLARRTGR